jgi:hypothetical protein
LKNITVIDSRITRLVFPVLIVNGVLVTGSCRCDIELV